MRCGRGGKASKSLAGFKLKLLPLQWNGAPLIAGSCDASAANQKGHVTAAREVCARPKRAWPFLDDGASEPNIDIG